MHAIIADKARPAAIPEDHALAGGKDAQSKKELAKDSSDEIIKTEETPKNRTSEETPKNRLSEVTLS